MHLTQKKSNAFDPEKIKCIWPRKNQMHLTQKKSKAYDPVKYHRFFIHDFAFAFHIKNALTACLMQVQIYLQKSIHLAHKNNIIGK